MWMKKKIVSVITTNVVMMKFLPITLGSRDPLKKHQCRENPASKLNTVVLFWGSPGGKVVNNPPANAGDARDTGLILELGRSPWRRAWQLTPVFLTGKFYGQRSLASYSSYSCRVGHDWMIELTHINSISIGGYFTLMLGWWLICSYTAWDSL